jgi:hypothetical protein
MLIVAVAALALTSGSMALQQPRLLPIILVLNFWFLGYHHVIATMTRVLFDVESLREYKILVTWVPLGVLAGTVAMYNLIGPWAVSTTYLHWQWFHYTRQSYGIAEAYRRKADPQWVGDRALTTWALYLLPLLGLMYRSFQQPSKFLGLDVKMAPVPGPLVAAVAALTLLSIVLWARVQVRAWLAGRLQTPFVLYMLSHFVIFAVGYLAIPTINEGWLVLNIWHNAQYILFVWMYNNRRFQDRIDPAHHFLSMLSQRKNVVWYGAFFVSLSSIVYYAVDRVLNAVSAPDWLPLSILVYATINFHHYVVDGVVWRLRRAPIRRTLGLAV